MFTPEQEAILKAIADEKLAHIQKMLVDENYSQQIAGKQQEITALEQARDDEKNAIVAVPVKEVVADIISKPVAEEILKG